MRTKNLLIPAYLIFLLMMAKIVWSEIDSEQASQSFQVIESGFLTGKFSVIIIFTLLSPFLLLIRKPIKNYGFFPWVLFIFATISLSWTYDFGTTLYYLIILSCVFGYPLAMNATWGSENSIRIIWIFSSLVILASSIISATGDAHGIMGGRHDGAWKGLFPHKNTFGPFIVINMFVTLFMRRTLRLPLIVAVLIVCTDAVILFYVRSSTAIVAGIGGLAAGLVLLPIRHTGLRILWRIVAALVLLASISTVVLNTDAVFELLGRDSTLTGRSKMWAQVYDMTFQHKLGTGYGTGGGSQVSIEIQKAMNRQDTLGVQSGYLTMALELGWFSVAIFVAWLLFAMIRNYLSMSYDPSHALFVALAVQHLIVSYSESFGCISPSWSLMVIMTTLIATRTNLPGRSALRLRSRRTAAMIN